MIGTHERLGHAAIFEATIRRARPQFDDLKLGKKMGIPSSRRATTLITRYMYALVKLHEPAGCQGGSAGLNI